MTKALNSFGELARELALAGARMVAAGNLALIEAGKVIQTDAKARIGEYQDGTGPFTAWANLADSTEHDKAAKGYSLGAPLLRTGDLRESIVTEAGGDTVVVGSRLAIAAYQEFGTNRIPPRPFIGPAAFAAKGEIVHVVGQHAAAALAGVPVLHKRD